MTLYLDALGTGYGLAALVLAAHKGDTAYSCLSMAFCSAGRPGPEVPGPVETAETAPHGVMSRLACTVHTPAGRAFVKGTRHNDPQAWVYRHEARVTRCAPLAPGVLWEADAGGWLLYGRDGAEGPPD